MLNIKRCKLLKETETVVKMPLTSPEWTCLGRADEHYQFLFTSRAMGVLIHYRHITGTWRDCMGDKSRPVSNSIFSFRLPDGWTLVKCHRCRQSQESTETPVTDCWDKLRVVMSCKLHQRGLKLRTEGVFFRTVFKSGLVNKEEGNVNRGVLSPRDETSWASWVLLTSQTSAWGEDFSGRSRVSLWATPLWGPLCFWSQTPGRQKKQVKDFSYSFSLIWDTDSWYY